MSGEPAPHCAPLKPRSVCCAQRKWLRAWKKGGKSRLSARRILGLGRRTSLAAGRPGAAQSLAKISNSPSTNPLPHRMCGAWMHPVVATAADTDTRVKPSSSFSVLLPSRPTGGPTTTCRVHPCRGKSRIFSRWKAPDPGWTILAIMVGQPRQEAKSPGKVLSNHTNLAKLAQNPARAAAPQNGFLRPLFFPFLLFLSFLESRPRRA